MTGNDRITYINIDALGALVITTGLSRDRCYNVRSDDEPDNAGVLCSRRAGVRTMAMMMVRVMVMVMVLMMMMMSRAGPG